MNVNLHLFFALLLLLDNINISVSTHLISDHRVVLGNEKLDKMHI